MQNVNAKIQGFLEKHKNDKRYLFILFLLSVMVIVIVCLSLMTPAISMSGDLICEKEQHIHDDTCYSEVLVCTENTEPHQHSEDCYTTETSLVCTLEENEEHTHSDECYSQQSVLICEIPETTVHTHNEKCYENTLICEQEEHIHNENCYETSHSETNTTEEEKIKTDEPSSEPDDPEIIELDPIDAERDALLNSVKKSRTLKKISAYASNGNVTFIDESSVDFGVFIKTVTHKEIAGTSTEENMKTVKFTIHYSLPENTLMNDNENRQIHCLLPDNVIIPEQRTGIVRKEGQEIGTYKITDDGYIIIKFDQNFVKDGSTAISGDISFNANVLKTDEESNYETVTIGRVSVNIPFLNEVAPKEDLSINKSFVGYDRNTYKVSYKLDINSYNGSGDGDIAITDMLYYTDSTLIHLDWQNGDTAVFTKKDASGSTSEITGTVSVADDGTVTITGLPKLEANESYSIVYTATLTPDSQTQIIKTNNKATVSNGTLTDESIYYGETAISCGITKGGQYNDKTDMVEWTINVTNPFGDSLENYSITDDMLGITANGLQIKDSSGNIIETLNESNNWTGSTGSLDKSTNTFSFNASVSGLKYTLFYETPVPSRDSIANNNISNKASLKNGNKEINAPQANAYIGADRRGVYKKYNSVSYDDSGNASIEWIVNLDFQVGDFNNQLYKDIMTSEDNYHYMTPQQKDTLKLLGYKANSAEVSLVKDIDYTVKWYDVQGNETTSDSENIYSFEIIFADNQVISELCDIDIYYSATCITESMTEGSERIFTNKAEFSELEYSAEYKEKKKEPFEKYDSSVAGQVSSVNETHHNTNDLERDENGNLILKWYIDANESRYFPSSTDAVLTDILPAGTIINEGSIRYGDWSKGYFSVIENSAMTYTVSSNENSQQTVIFNVPSSLHNGKKFRIDYELTVSEEYVLENKNARGHTSFKNVVTDGNYTAEQTQVIERSLITKTGSDPENTYDGYINYSIDINPQAELLSNNGKIIVSDKINYEYNVFVPTLSEIKVYSVEKDSNGVEILTELDPSKYNLSYTNDNIDAKFKVELPDKQHLRIKYTYYCVYKSPELFEQNDTGANIYNSVQIEFDSSTQNDDYQNKYYLNKESSAHAVTDDYVKIEKVDIENYGIKLTGAEFALYKWDGSQWQIMTGINSTEDGGKEPIWGAEDAEPYKNSTGSSGKAILPDLENDTLYKIVELTAPVDYVKSVEPNYFALNKSPTSIPADVKASDVKVLLKGGIITVPNKKMQKTEVEVQKYWHDPPGFTGEHGDIEVDLYQSKTDPSGKVDGPEISFSFTDSQGNADSRSFNVKRGDSVTMKIRTLRSYMNLNNGVTINGSVVNCYDTGDQWYVSSNPDYPYLSLKMTHYMEGWVTDYVEGWQNDPNYYNEYTFNYTNVTENMNFSLYFNDSQSFSKYSIFVGDQEVGVPITGIPDDAVYIETVTLNGENNWSHVWNNIPATDEFGYNYYYYIQEKTSVDTYTPQYNGNGTNKGTIYLTNKGEGYTNEMPATGGTGRKLLIITGSVMISGSALLYYLSKQRNKRRRHY